MIKTMNPFWPKHSMLFKGGSSGATTVAPAVSAPAATPPTATTVEVQQAARDARKQASRRRGLQSTVLAGETGGYGAENGKTTVLGGVGGGS